MGRNLTTLHTQPQDEDVIDTRLDYAGVRLSKQPIAQLKGLASAVTERSVGHLKQKAITWGQELPTESPLLDGGSIRGVLV